MDNLVLIYHPKSYNVIFQSDSLRIVMRHYDQLIQEKVYKPEELKILTTVELNPILDLKV